MSLIVIDVTAGGAPELCEEIIAAAIVQTNTSDSGSNLNLAKTGSNVIEPKNFPSETV